VNNTEIVDIKQTLKHLTKNCNMKVRRIKKWGGDKSEPKSHYRYCKLIDKG